jgi:hypothetical protein
VNFNVQQNPFQGSYLFNYGKNPALAATQTQQNQDASVNGFSGYQAFLDNYMRTRNANEKRQQKVNQNNQPQTLEQLWQELGQKKQKVSQLQFQLNATNDPQVQQMLQTMFGNESQSYFNLENQASLMFRGPGSGFVGSTGRIDQIGGSITMS